MAQKVLATQVWRSELSPQQPWKTLRFNENLQSACGVWETQGILGLVTSLVRDGLNSTFRKRSYLKGKGRKAHKISTVILPSCENATSWGTAFQTFFCVWFPWLTLDCFLLEPGKMRQTGSLNSEVCAATNHTGWENSYLFLLPPTPLMAHKIKDVQLTSIALTGICKHLLFHNKGMKSTRLQQRISCHQSAFMHKSQTTNVYCAYIMCKLNSFKKLRSLLYLNT